MDFTYLMQEIGKHLNLGEIQIRDESFAMLGIEETLVSIQYLKESEQVLFYSFIFEWPENLENEVLLSLYETILAGQAFYFETAGASLAINKQLNAVILQLALPITQIVPDQMLGILENFIRVAEHWKITCQETILTENKNNSDHNSTPTSLDNSLMQGMLKI